MAKNRTLYIGSAAIRFAVGTPYIPAPNETIRSDANYIFAPDGRMLLSAVAASRLGFDTVLCARVGDDYYGDRLIEICKQEGLHVSNVKAAKEKQTELLLELVEENGPHRTIRFPGASRKLPSDLVESAFGCYPDAIVTSLESDPDTVLHACALAAQKNLPFILDATSPLGAIPRDFPFEDLKKAEILVLSEANAKVFSGINPTNEESRKLACYTLRKRFDVRYILLQLGIRGCFLYDGKYFSAISAFDADPTDPTGASEAFIAALTGTYLDTGDIRAAAEFANTVYAKTADIPGGYRSLPRRSEL